MKRGPYLARVAGGLLALLLTAPDAAEAWAEKTQLAISESARKIAPPALARQLERHAERFRSGVLTANGATEPSDREKNPDGSGNLDAAILQQVEWAIQAIKTHEPFTDLAFRLGRLSHLIALANNPLQSSNTDSWEPRLSSDYLRYVESAQDRFQLVVYGRLDAPGTPQAWLRESLERSREIYPVIGKEYRRIGSIDGPRLFDDRSSAFGSSAVAFNRAISDIARILRYIWLEAGGADTRGGGRALRPPRTPS